MGKFINTEHRDNIDSLVVGLKDILKNPYYKWNDKSGTAVTYFNQNKEASTLDESSKCSKDTVLSSIINVRNLLL